MKQYKMDTEFLCRIYLVLFYNGVTVVSGQNARITAPTQFVFHTDQIEIDCQPAGSLYKQINALSLLKNNQPMVSAGSLNGQTHTAWSDFTVQGRATINSPNLDTITSAQLRVTISASNTQCDDGAVYTCKVTGLDNDFNPVPNNEVSKNVSILVKPDGMNQMQISPLPLTTGQYLEGENITLSCTGTVGAYANKPIITWCIERNGDFSPSDLESDRYFRSISQTSAQVVGAGPKTSCQYKRTSTVVYQVAIADINTKFWCQITAPGDNPICGQGTVRQRMSIEVANKPTTYTIAVTDYTLDGNSVKNKDLPVIEISIGIFALLVLITAVATIFICIPRKKTSQNDKVQMDVISESKYEELQTKKEENTYNIPKTQAGSDMNISVYCEAIQTTDRTSTYDEIRRNGKYS